MDMLADLDRQQKEMRSIARELTGLSTEPSPPPRERLGDLRRRLADLFLDHLPKKDRLVYARLYRHPDPAVVETAHRFAAEGGNLFDIFIRHSGRWTPDLVDQNWFAFRASVRQLASVIEDRIEREETQLLPHLADAPPAVDGEMEEGRDWQADGPALRDLLSHRPAS